KASVERRPSSHIAGRLRKPSQRVHTEVGAEQFKDLRVPFPEIGRTAIERLGRVGEKLLLVVPCVLGEERLFITVQSGWVIVERTLPHDLPALRRGRVCQRWCAVGQAVQVIELMRELMDYNILTVRRVAPLFEGMFPRNDHGTSSDRLTFSLVWRKCVIH